MSIDLSRLSTTHLFQNARFKARTMFYWLEPFVPEAIKAIPPVATLALPWRGGSFAPLMERWPPCAGLLIANGRLAVRHSSSSDHWP
jgi:hypothetical protein